ncbi:HTH_Tnp_Tc3_2 domain-containing protein [Trichonephila clavipes]|nr:HTH_Tnp_Tc3_2 domain-containing protein [Trichonephila clavipes]
MMSLEMILQFRKEEKVTRTQVGRIRGVEEQQECSSWPRNGSLKLLCDKMLSHTHDPFSKSFKNLSRPDHRDENCRLVDAPCCWPGGLFGVCRQKLLGAVDTRTYPCAENRVWSDQENREEREDGRIVRQALVDPTVTRSTVRADVGVAIVPQTISRHLAEANLKTKRPFRALPLTPEHRQPRLQ